MLWPLVLVLRVLVTILAWMCRPPEDVVPPWVVLLPDGCGTLRSSEAGQQPTAACRESGIVLGFHAGGIPIAIAPGPEGRVDWLTTVDQPLNGNAAIRRLGPGIVVGETVVRLWVPAAGGPIVLTEGPVERAIDAVERMERAWRQR